MSFYHNFKKKVGNNKCWQESRDTGSLIHYWWECKWNSHCRKQFDSSFKKLNINLSYDPAIQLPDTDPRKMKIYV